MKGAAEEFHRLHPTTYRRTGATAGDPIRRGFRVSDTSNYRGDSPITCGYSEAEIEARAISKSSKLWKVRCLNGAAHKNDDSHPSAFYYPENGWYGCNVCGKQGFASDRLYSAQQKRVNGRRPPRSGSKRKEFLPDRIPSHAKLTETYPYKRVAGRTIHRVRRYDWVEEDDEGNSINCKEYLPQHLANGKWKHRHRTTFNGNRTTQTRSRVRSGCMSLKGKSARTRSLRSYRAAQQSLLQRSVRIQHGRPTGRVCASESKLTIVKSCSYRIAMRPGRSTFTRSPGN